VKSGRGERGTTATEQRVRDNGTVLPSTNNGKKNESHGKIERKKAKPWKGITYLRSIQQ